MTRHLITSALPYINGIKHLGGNLVGRCSRRTCTRGTCGSGGARRRCTSAPPTSTAPPRRSWPRRRPGSRWTSSARSSTTRRRRSTTLRALLRLLRPQLLRREPRDHAALRPEAARERVHRGAGDPPGVLDRRRPLPAGPLHRRYVPALRVRQGARRPVRELHPGAGPPHRPDRAALRDQRQQRAGGPGDQAPLPPPVEAVRRGRGVDRRDKRRVAAPGVLDRPQVAHRGPARPLDHP